MDQRISYITTLKNHILQRNSIPNVASSIPQVAKESPEDIEYLFVRKQVIQSLFFANANKHVSIRLNNWIQRLDKIQANKVWQTNRNNYIKLLNLMCHCEYLARPFNQLPPQCDLPHLRKHQITQIIDEVERSIKVSRMSSRRASINIENANPPKPKAISNFQLKRFKTDSYGEEDSDTIQMKPWNGTRNFQTDLQDKTISFNQGSKMMDLFEDWDHNESMGNFKTKILKTNCSSKQLLKDIQNNYQTQPYKKQQQVLPKCPKLPLNKKTHPTNNGSNVNDKSNRNKEYWQSIEVTYNNSNLETPKYLSKYQMNESSIAVNEVEIVSFRENQSESCDCTNKLLGQGWFSQLFKQIKL